MGNHYEYEWEIIMKKSFTAIIGLVIIILFTVSCSQPTSTPTPLATSTAQPRITFTPCPRVRQFEFTNIENHPKVIYALIDKSGSYKHLTQRALDTIYESIYRSVNPGDYVYIGWIGEDVTKPESLFFQGEVPFINIPESLTSLNVTAQPSIDAPYLPSNTPAEQTNSTPVPTKNMTTFEQIAATKTALAFETSTAVFSTSVAATQTSEAILVEQTQQANLCQSFVNNENLKSDFERYQHERREAIDQFAHGMKRAIDGTNHHSHSQTYIYESLYIASRILQDRRESGKYSQFELVIFSDMQETGSRYNNLSFNFEQVDIVIGMVYCEKAVNCQWLENTWIPFFTNNGAKTPKIKLIQETSVDALIELLTSNNSQ